MQFIFQNLCHIILYGNIDFTVQFLTIFKSAGGTSKVGKRKVFGWFSAKNAGFKSISLRIFEYVYFWMRRGAVMYRLNLVWIMVPHCFRWTAQKLCIQNLRLFLPFSFHEIFCLSGPVTGLTTYNTMVQLWFLIGPGGLRAPCVLACAMRSLNPMLICLNIKYQNVPLSVKKADIP